MLLAGACSSHRIQQEIGFGGTEAGFGRKRAEDGNGANPGAASHFEIFRRIADVNAGGGMQTHLAQG